MVKPVLRTLNAANNKNGLKQQCHIFRLFFRKSGAENNNVMISINANNRAYSEGF